MLYFINEFKLKDKFFVCEYFGVDFNYFMESQVQNNNVKQNHGGVVGNMNGNIFNEKKGNKSKSNDEN
jgi:hypothetical protein